jgi:hypothetical protein
MTITMETATRKVKQGNRMIGFIAHFPAISRIGRREGWAFIPNSKSIAARYPAPSPVFDDPKAALRDVIAKVG